MNDFKSKMLAGIRGTPPKADGDQLADLRNTRSDVAPTTVEGREQRTSRVQDDGPPKDGRRLRATGRNEQLNIKVSKDLIERLKRLTRETKSSQGAIIEWAVQFYEDDLRGKKVD